jgi:hypothetical protein
MTYAQIGGFSTPVPILNVLKAMQRTLSRRRQREVEDLARALLEHSSRVNPYDLADRAKIDFFLARGVLRMLAKQGRATEFPSGSFGRPASRSD